MIIPPRSEQTKKIQNMNQQHHHHHTKKSSSSQNIVRKWLNTSSREPRKRRTKEQVLLSQCVIPLSSIEDENKYIKECVLMGFSRCGNYLYSYSVPQKSFDEALLFNSGTPIEDECGIKFAFQFWKFNWHCPITLYCIVPMLGIHCEENDSVPMDFESIRYEIQQFNHNMSEHIPEFALYANPGTSALSHTLHIQITESVDHELYYNYIYCNVDENERKHLICIIPSPIDSHVKKFDYNWGLIFQFDTMQPHPSQFIPFYCVVSTAGESIVNSNVKTRRTQVCAIPCADSIDLIKYDIREQIGKQALLNTTTTSPIIESDRVIVSNVLYKKKQDTIETLNDCYSHYYLYVVSHHSLNIEELVNNQLADNERLTDYNYRIVQQHGTEIVVIIHAEYFVKGQPQNRTRLLLFVSINVSQVVTNILFQRRYKVNSKKAVTITQTLCRLAEQMMDLSRGCGVSLEKVMITDRNENIFNQNISKPYIRHHFQPIAILSPSTPSQ
jgi:hypothetical protein